MLRLHSFIGFLVLALLAWLFSEKRRDVRIRILLTGLGLQICLALLLLKLPGAQQAFLWLNNAVQALEESTRAGTGFVFGYLGGARRKLYLGVSGAPACTGNQRPFLPPFLLESNSRGCSRFFVGLEEDHGHWRG